MHRTYITLLNSHKATLNQNCTVPHVTMLSLRQTACHQALVRSRHTVAGSAQCLKTVARPRVTSRQNAVQTQASMGGKGDKKVLRREEEPEEYWVSKGERKGANPLKDPLAIIGLTAIFLPFVLLLIAIATGLVDISVYK